MTYRRPILVSCLVPALVMTPSLAGQAAAHMTPERVSVTRTVAAPMQGPALKLSARTATNQKRWRAGSVSAQRKGLAVARPVRGPSAPPATRPSTAATTITAAKPTGATQAPAAVASTPPVVGQGPASLGAVSGAPVPSAGGSREEATVSGVAMPTGNLPGWRQTLAEDFNRTALPYGWSSYTGQPGGNPGGWWDPSHVQVRDSKLVLAGYRDGAKWVTGGVMNWDKATTTYGKYEVRFKMAKGKGVKYALLLWPESERWPIDGEIDFAEDGGGNRTSTSATLHYGADNKTVQRQLSADFSTWQTLGVEWTPGKIVYTLNGVPWSTVTGAMVPSTPMRLALQSEAGTCGDPWTPCPDASTPSRVDLEIDWAVAYQRV